MSNAAPAPRFMVDHMAIKLGKYLRILGYDAAWDLGLSTRALIGKANAEDRIFLTRNRHLPDRYPPVRQPLIIDATEPVRQLEEVSAALALGPPTDLFARCIRCNVTLDTVADRSAIRAKVHPNVYARHAAFFTCPVCGAVFWKGSHVRTTCRKLGLAEPLTPS